MPVTAINTRPGFEQALRAAREVGDTTPLPGLAAPLGTALLGKVSEAWDAIDSALRDAYWRGIDLAQSAIDAALECVDAVVSSAGAKAKEVQEALLAKLQTYLGTLIDEALLQVRSSIDVGGRQLTLTTVELAQTIAVSGSLKASITEIVTFTANGQLVVTSAYGA